MLEHCQCTEETCEVRGTAVRHPSQGARRKGFTHRHGLWHEGRHHSQVWLEGLAVSDHQWHSWPLVDHMTLVQISKRSSPRGHHVEGPLGRPPPPLLSWLLSSDRDKLSKPMHWSCSLLGLRWRPSYWSLRCLNFLPFLVSGKGQRGWRGNFLQATGEHKQPSHQLQAGGIALIMKVQKRSVGACRGEAWLTLRSGSAGKTS